MDGEPIRMTESEYEKRKQKFLKLKKHVLKIVENLIEPEVNESTLVDSCQYLCKNDYYDVTVERSIQDYCGYPICSNNLTDLSKKRQQYKICLKTHQVFDITDRKMFCSNVCFTGSNYLKDQLEEQPLWMRESSSRTEKSANVNLYKKSQGSFGDEIMLDINLNKDLIRELHKEGDSLKCKLYCKDCCSSGDQENRSNEKMCKNKNCSTNKTSGVQLDKSINFPYIQEEDLNLLKDKLSNLKIKEKKPIISNDERQSM